MPLPFADRLILLVAGFALLTGAALAGSGYLGKRAGERRGLAIALTNGLPERAPDLLVGAGCAACHEIPGIPGADGAVGPPLKGVAGRHYLGGVLTNTPENMIRWLLDPPAVDPLTAMPATGITEQEARDIAAYLYQKT